MSDRWAVRFPRSSMHAALALRLRDSVEACDAGDHVWLKSNGGRAEEIDRILRCIPDAVRYAADDGGTITRVGRRIPEGRLPDGPWSPFSSVVRFCPQPAAMPARAGPSAPLRLVRMQQEESPSAVVISLREWVDYADVAARVRLEQLRFAVSGDQRALILGSPSPSLRGLYYCDRHGLLLPCGYGWAPRVESEIVRRCMRLSPGDLALFAMDGSYERIPAESVIPASRSARAGRSHRLPKRQVHHDRPSRGGSRLSVAAASIDVDVGRQRQQSRVDER